MKLSISWIFDHINADWKKVNVKELVDTFNKTTAEIEFFYQPTIDLAALTLAQVKTITETHIVLFSPELDIEITLSLRSDLAVHDWVLVTTVNNQYDWALSTALGAQKEYSMPALTCPEPLTDGSWKKFIEVQDHIIEVDNKSITNRPDLWGHRGFAREVAVICNYTLKPYEEFLEKYELLETTKDFLKTEQLEIQINNPQQCKRLAALSIKEIQHAPSTIFMAFRLAKVDSRVINAIVDTTNYTMLDISQPMHAFDANVFNDKQCVARSAKVGEKLVLLDGQEVTLNEHDCVIANGSQAVSLAGIMGGKSSGVNPDTKSIVLESSLFDAATIRKTSARLKIRTESSARYEKSLNPLQNVDAIRRFLKLYKEQYLVIVPQGPILSVGQKEKDKIVIVEHDFIEKKLGLSIEEDAIKLILKELNFGVSIDDSTYKITIPAARATKDISIPEDIVEEVARIYGYSKIPYVMPTLETEEHDISKVLRLRNIKQFMAYSACMMELNSYPFYDEDFVKTLGDFEKSSLFALSPVSQNWKYLVNSLVPHLFKAIQTNILKSTTLRFFEVNNIWLPDNTEKKSVAGIMYDYNNGIDFYAEKFYIDGLLKTMGLQVEWRKMSAGYPWYDKNRAAEIYANGIHIGSAGMVDKKFLLSVTECGNAFVVELDADYLSTYKEPLAKVKPLSKYPEVHVDISLMVPLTVTVEAIKKVIIAADKLIKKIQLIDVFEKPEWLDKKSMTLRYSIVDEHKTLSKEEIDTIVSRVHEVVIKAGAQIR